MGEFKGTQGLWVVDESGDVSSEDGRAIIAVIAGFEPSDEDRENAKLIAAAPDLLEVLQLILSYHDDGNCALHKEDVVMARNAIKKALGQ